jgi:hypothetical protein
MKNIRKKQGIFLSVMILFLIIGDLQIPYYLANPDALKTIYSSVPTWYPVSAVVGLASNVAIIIGMWRMKKWAAWLLIAYFASKVFVDFMYVLPEKQALVCMTTVVGAGFWFWAVRRKWNLFE